MITRSTIGTGWHLTLTDPHPDAPADLRGRTVPAAVPGCVHTDLLAAGLLADPYVGLNEAGQHWIGRSGWTWTTSFDLPAGDAATRRELVFHGLDTVAEVSVNGHVVGRTANMHRTHAFDVTALVTPTGNELRVHIGSVYDYTDARRAESGELPSTYDEPFNHVRKMAANFGWDWGPTLVTAGIWKPVELLGWSGARLESVRPAVTVDRPGQDGPATVTAHVAVRRAPDAPDAELLLTATVAGQRATGRVPAGSDTAELTVAVPDARLWWPIGLGGQPLYDLEVGLSSGAGTADRWSRRIGFRTAELHTAPDRAGTPFEILVNGVHVPVRGVNWIPDDCFVSRLGRADYAAALDHAVEANVNLMRVWGGGIYEKDEFYDLCDERGLLVWQDFLFACATYSEEEPIRGEVLAEARDNVTRLAPHPSLVLWNGNNENLWGHRDWGWPEVLGDRGWGLAYYTELLPAVVAELDPGRRTGPAAPGRAPPTGTPTTRCTGRSTSGTSGTSATGPRTPSTSRVSSPSSASRARPAGPPSGARSTTARRPRPGRSPTPTRRPRTAWPSCSAASCRTCRTGVGGTRSRRCPTGSTSPSSTRPAPSGSASTTCAASGRAAPARSCGSSTTAGRWPPGRPSTATATASSPGTRCAPPTGPGTPPCRRPPAAAPSSGSPTTAATRGGPNSPSRSTRWRVSCSRRPCTPWPSPTGRPPPCRSS
ncbi:glycoside hydrolase family 2 protein [Kitasatospora fiedleri]|uniref:glycoside hydrolase family 2 protein n=1 Tax=Kitasatospora fiedleri TaxID=2991545 RepID=UPI00249A584F|nr:hypothetical protein [Kitasatospora fiedleri]